MPINRLKKQYKKCLDVSNQLEIELQKLSSIASDIYGQPLRADICNADEIEFRLSDTFDDAFVCVKIEDIIKQ